jgi:hypothetical protein
MIRIILVCAVLLVSACPGVAGEKAKATETIIRLKVQPARAPRPVLKYQLLPELHEMNPGNAIQGYHKCFSEQQFFFFNKAANEKRDKWATMPLKDLPVKELRGYGGLALRQADYAARLDSADWQILLKLKTEGIELLVPDLQQMRMIAYALQVRLRGEVADRRFDDAIVTTKTLFAMSRHMGEHPSAVGFLVANAVASLVIEPFEELVQQPGCPNLFWALTDLPSPLVSLRLALQGDRTALINAIGTVDDKEPMTKAQVEKAIQSFQSLLNGFRVEPKQDVRKWLAIRTSDKAKVTAIRRRLVERGLADDVVKSFPATQVLLLDDKMAYEERRDNALKGLLLPYWQVQALGDANPAKDDSLLLSRIVPFFGKVRQSQARTEQSFALLRCVEALRLHAAEHNGKFPAKLAEVKLPLPVDPISGQPFGYRLEARTAILRGAAPRGLEKVAFYNIRYDVTLAK